MIWKKDAMAFPESTRYYQNFEYMFVFSKGSPKTVHLIADRKNYYVGTKIYGTSRLADGTTIPKTTSGKVNEYGVRFNVWEFPTEKNNTSGHPAPFPLKLPTDHILTWTNEKDIVFDPFCGSGTTAVASHNENRNFIGCEIDKTYCDNANERLWQTTRQLNLFHMEEQ